MNSYSDNRRFKAYSWPNPSKETKRTDLCEQHKSALNPQPSNERLKIMSTHVSATAPQETPHEAESQSAMLSNVALSQ